MAAEPRTRNRVRPAQWRGTCAECHGPITPGDPIEWDPDGAAGRKAVHHPHCPLVTWDPNEHRAQARKLEKKLWEGRAERGYFFAAAEAKIHRENLPSADAMRQQLLTIAEAAGTPAPAALRVAFQREDAGSIRLSSDEWNSWRTWQREVRAELGQAAGREWSEVTRAYSDHLQLTQLIDGVEGHGYADPLRPEVSLDGARTGRMVYRVIPMQSVARRLRYLFPAGDGYTFVSVDLSSIEPRVVASLLEDQAAVDSLLCEDQGNDLYTELATRAAADADADPGDTLDAADRRAVAKTAVNAVINGMGEENTVRRFGPALAAAVRERLAEVLRLREQLAGDGDLPRQLTQTWAGRPLVPADASADDQSAHKKWTVLVQGSARDIFAEFTWRIHEAFKRRLGRDVSAWFWLPLHDEIVFCVPTGVVEPLAQSIATAMAGAAIQGRNGPIPLRYAIERRGSVWEARPGTVAVLHGDPVPTLPE